MKHPCELRPACNLDHHDTDVPRARKLAYNFGRPQALHAQQHAPNSPAVQGHQLSPAIQQEAAGHSCFIRSRPYTPIHTCTGVDVSRPKCRTPTVLQSIHPSDAVPHACKQLLELACVIGLHGICRHRTYGGGRSGVRTAARHAPSMGWCPPKWFRRDDTKKFLSTMQHCVCVACHCTTELSGMPKKCCGICSCAASLVAKRLCTANSPSHPPMNLPPMKTWGTVRHPVMPCKVDWISSPLSVHSSKTTAAIQRGSSRPYVSAE